MIWDRVTYAAGFSPLRIGESITAVHHACNRKRFGSVSVPFASGSQLLPAIVIARHLALLGFSPLRIGESITAGRTDSGP